MGARKCIATAAVLCVLCGSTSRCHAEQGRRLLQLPTHWVLHHTGPVQPLYKTLETTGMTHCPTLLPVWPSPSAGRKPHCCWVGQLQAGKGVLWSCFSTAARSPSLARPRPAS